jgi:hypothetical protein
MYAQKSSGLFVSFTVLTGTQWEELKGVSKGVKPTLLTSFYKP